ncbi:hypothetical protein CY35_18G026000 [Sphagnum magellanicum]|nr:hypothetical protein CY35_18G026000 [Sphagnum magellanicum]
MYMSGSEKASKLVVPASQIHVTSVFRIATSSSSTTTSSLPRSQLQEKDYSFLTIVASSKGYKRREQNSLALVPRTCALDQEACARIVFVRCYFDAGVAVAPVCAALKEHLAAVAGCYPEPARQKLPLAQRLPSKPKPVLTGFRV